MPLSLWKKFVNKRNLLTFATPKPVGSIEIWCNGSTRDSGPLSPGSNPGISTNLNVQPAAGHSDGAVAQLVRAHDS